MRRFILFYAVIGVLFSVPVKAQMPCQYDCLAKGGLPEICEAQCGGTPLPRPRVSGNRVGAVDDVDNEMPAMLEEYRGTASKTQRKESSEGDGSSASGGGSPYFSCIKECRDAGNKLLDCRTLCSED